MTDEEKKFLKSTKKMMPNLDVFRKLVWILGNVEKKTDQLMQSYMLEKSKAI